MGSSILRTPSFWRYIRLRKTGELPSAGAVQYQFSRDICAELFPLLYQKGYRKLYMPSYLCDTVSTDLSSLGFTLIRYPVADDFTALLPDEDMTGAVLLLVNYFGMHHGVSSAALCALRQSGCCTVVDNAHSCAAHLRTCSLGDADFSFTSYYKSLPVPDGAELVAVSASAKDIMKDLGSYPRYDRSGRLIQSLKWVLNSSVFFSGRKKRYLTPSYSNCSFVSSRRQRRHSGSFLTDSLILPRIDTRSIRGDNLEVYRSLYNAFADGRHGFTPVKQLSQNDQPAWFACYAVSREVRDAVVLSCLDRKIDVFPWPTLSLADATADAVSRWERLMLFPLAREVLEAFHD